MTKLYGLRANEMHDFVVPSQIKDSASDQVIFKVKYLTSKELADLQNELFQIQGFGKNRKEKLETGTQTLKTLLMGLRGWHNFTYEDGEPIGFESPSGSSAEKDEIMLRNIDKIPPSTRDEIAAHIRGESTVGNE